MSTLGAYPLRVTLPQPASAIPWPNSAVISTPGAQGSANPSNAVLRITPFYVPNAVRIVGQTITTTVAGEAGSRIRCGIYALHGTTGTPTGPPLNGANGVAVPADAAPGQQEAACNVVLGPGWYGSGAACELATTTPPTVATVGATAWFPVSAASANSAGWSYAGQTAGLLPTLTGAIVGASSLMYRMLLRTGVL